MSDKSKDTAKKIMVGTIIACIIIFLISTSFKSTYLDQIAESTFGKNYIAQYGKTYPDIIQRVDTQLGIYSKMRSDLIISLILVIAFTLSVYYFITKKLGKTVFQTILFGLVVFDFGRASAPMLAEIKVPQSKTKLLPKSTAEPDYVNFIKQDYAEYRVLPYVSEPSSAAFTGFSIESVDGYHPAKLRIYQDLMDVFADGVTQKPRFFDNPLLMELLNIKYIILDQASLIPNFQVVFNGSKVVLKNNNNALRYWFVDSVFVQSDLQIIKSIKEQSFNPKTVAFITNNGSTLPPISPTDSASSIKVIERTAHKVTLSTFVPKGNHFMFIGEIFYPVGWKCYIDGVPTEIFKTNYAFRGIVVPEGNHTITMVYEDSIIKTFRPFAIFANLTTFVALLLSLFFVADSYRKKYLKSKNVVSKEESSGSPFTKTPQVGPVRLRHILNTFSSFDQLEDASPNDFEKIDGIGTSLANTLSNFWKNKTFTEEVKAVAYKQLELMEKQNVYLLTIRDTLYPKLLKEIYDPPIYLFVRGSIEVLSSFSIAVVGTRYPTDYGKRITKIMSDYLISKNVTIVSGLAYGIDTIAHQVACSLNGCTIAVLGSGVDQTYTDPKGIISNKMLEKGAIISEEFIGTPPVAENFPKRNRIISGLTQATLVIESAIDGGAMITAKHANEQNREVFAVPGSIFSKKSEGTNKLIQSGAKVILEPNDILSDFQQTPQNKEQLDTPPRKQSDQDNQLTLNLSFDEQRIINLIKPNPIHIDKIIELSGLNISNVQLILFELELKSIIQQTNGKYYQLI
ncbi:hypothetical protein CHS0354_023781 [Potamilus streckersoni]|uniref:Uncharacterized protein n=1 Tax=Potamilus streckersoni TaxID=2493646 RepID=A0AAE0VMG4_9BIVA|nr:hypothetical protein CHS0354_023781 [Potamilus streckersoni]